MELVLAVLIAAIGAGTPLLLAGLGELVTERSGVLNLGVEGMMLVGAVTAFATTLETGSIWLGVLAAVAAGGVMAVIFGFLALTLMANQVAAGLALTIFGAGVSAFAGRAYSGVALPSLPVETGDVPLVARIVDAFHPLVYLSWALLAVVAWTLLRSRVGLVLRSVGESPQIAHVIGYPVIRIRYLATIFGGMAAGAAGAYLAVVSTRLWAEGMTAGRGWIAIALVVFASWRPGRLVIGAYLFGGATILQLFAQGAGVPVPSEAMSALPYIATIVVLVLISRNVAAIRRNAPVSLGRPFHPEG
jgi:general nucleoside transport system permease protein